MPNARRRRALPTLILGLIALSLTPCRAARAATPASLPDDSPQSLEGNEDALSSEARLQLDALLNEPYRAPAVLGPATDDPDGENAPLYTGASDQITLRQE